MLNFQTSFNLKNGRIIGPNAPAYIIAEIGSNHNGSLDEAKRLMDAAKAAGANAAKFQSFQVNQLIHTHNLQNQSWQPHPAWDTLERLSLPTAWHHKLNDYAHSIGIDFLSAPFDLERLELLNQLDVPAIKIASGDLTYSALLQAAAKTGKPILLSTGMAYLEEVESALKVLADAGCQEVGLFHCVSLYPPQFQDANIQAMITLKNTFNVPVGYSDHTPGSVVPLGAVALGASIIEKHLTLDKTQAGPDHPYALDVPEFTAMVAQICQLESALGSGIKEPTPGEIGERIGARRAVYTQKTIPAGQPIDSSHLRIVRHAYPQGIPASEAETVYGRKPKTDIPAGTLLTWDALAP